MIRAFSPDIAVIWLYRTSASNYPAKYIGRILRTRVQFSTLTLAPGSTYQSVGGGMPLTVVRKNALHEACYWYLRRLKRQVWSKLFIQGDNEGSMSLFRGIRLQCASVSRVIPWVTLLEGRVHFWFCVFCSITQAIMLFIKPPGVPMVTI